MQQVAEYEHLIYRIVVQKHYKPISVSDLMLFFLLAQMSLQHTPILLVSLVDICNCERNPFSL